MSSLPIRGIFYSFLTAGQVENEERFKHFERIAEIFTLLAIAAAILVVQLPVGFEVDKRFIYPAAGGVVSFSLVWFHLASKKIPGRVRIFIYGLLGNAATAFLVHTYGGVQSHFIFLYFLFTLGIGITLPLIYSLPSLILAVGLIFAEIFLTQQPTTTAIGLTTIHSLALILIVFLGRFYSGETALEKQGQEKVLLEKEKTLGKLKNEFVFIISRELKQPTTAIKGYVEKILHEHYSDLNTESKELLDLTDTNTDRLDNLLNDLLDVSQIEKEGLKVEVTNVFLGPIISEVISNQFFDAKSKRISLSQRGDTNVAVNADTDRLKEVLTNLVNNAIKYTPEGGKIAVDVKNEGEFVNVSVTDNGFGISPEDQEHLFEKFYRVENDQTRAVKGNGLGLFVTKNLVEKMGGEISVLSKLGEGTRFTFRLPRYRW